MVYCLLMTKSLIPTSHSTSSSQRQTSNFIPIHSEAVADSNFQYPLVHPVSFKTIDGDHFRRMALKSKGGAGPSSL